MGLGEKQRLFVKLIAKLIIFAYDEGYAFSFGDAYRSPAVFGEIGIDKGYGNPKSCHKSRLAVDFNLFELINGNWIYQKDTKSYEKIGEYWESLHELCSWGGRFNDGNHFSIQHNGMK
jgi:hypothetical protein